MKIIDFTLPEGKIKIKSNIGGQKTGLVIAGGRRPENNWLKSVAVSKEIYCADRGIESCLANNLKPTILCGDADSSEKVFWENAKDLGAKIILLDPAKDDTDLWFLLENIPNDEDLIVSGVWGGRFDHLYSNLFSLLEHKRKNKVQIVLADQEECLCFLNSGESLVFSDFEKINIESLALLPLQAVNEVTLSGVKWELKQAQLLLNHSYAISNLPEQKQITFTCDSGSVGFYLKYKI